VESQHKYNRGWKAMANDKMIRTGLSLRQLALVHMAAVLSDLSADVGSRTEVARFILETNSDCSAEQIKEYAAAVVAAQPDHPGWGGQESDTDANKAE
jgi:hypothetical protein